MDINKFWSTILHHLAGLQDRYKDNSAGENHCAILCKIQLIDFYFIILNICHQHITRLTIMYITIKNNNYDCTVYREILRYCRVQHEGIIGVLS